MRKLIGLLLAAHAAAGCAAGRDEVIFVTRTDVAVDFDVKPTTTLIGYKRDEMVLSPIDTNGNVLPVLTSVGVEAGAFNFGANHSFATGDAAVVMAKYFGTKKDLDTGDGEKISAGDLKGIGTEHNRIDKDRTGFVFATDTTLGLAVTWDAEAVPTAVSLGFKRKELAVVPLREPKGEAGKLALASLIATAHGGTDVAGPNDTGIVFGQTFATGWAATFLATHPGIRAAIGPAVIPDFAKAQAEQERLEKKADAENKPLFDQLDYASALADWHDDPARTGTEAADLRKDAAEAGLIPAGTIAADFRKNLVKTANHAGSKPENGAKFKALADARGIKVNKDQ